MHTKSDVKKFLDQHHFVPSKKMGQNFLFDINYQQRIITSANVTKEDDVIEIGPGLGAITKHLVKHARQVVAIELDKRLSEYLNTNIKKDNFHLINNDVLKVDFNNLIKEYDLKNIKVVANLPYSISSKIIASLMELGCIKEIYILVQKEMAERICAKVGSKDYNAFTALMQMFAKVDSLFKIPPANFVPAPQVDSIFLKIEYINQFNVNFKLVGDFLKLCFAQKRKTILNNLSAKYDKETIKTKLQELNLEPSIRSESLNPKELYQLYVKFNNH